MSQSTVNSGQSQQQSTNPSYASSGVGRASFVSTTSKNEKLPTIIYVKIVTAIVTLFGGAILAITINLWMPVRNYPEAFGDGSQVSNPQDQDIVKHETFSHVAYGQVRTKKKMCLDDLLLKMNDTVGPLGVYGCHHDFTKAQYFAISNRGELRKDNFCAEVLNTTEVVLTHCDLEKPEQYWVLYENQTIYHPSTDKCLSSRGLKFADVVFVETCRGGVYQEWEFDFVYKRKE